MSAEDLRMVPISGKTARDLIDLLAELRNYPGLRFRAEDLTKTIGEAATVAGEYHSLVEILGMELLECVGQATGRPICTVVTPESVKQAKAALEHTTPVLGNVIALPRAPERETAASIDAAVARAVAAMPPPLDLCIWLGGRVIDARPSWVVPPVDSEIEHGDRRLVVKRVRWAGGPRWDVITAETWPVPQQVEAAW